MEQLVCIVCPRGCTMTLKDTPDGLTVTGNACPRGKAFAIAETTQPMRTLCTTAATAFPAFPVLPVRVRGEIPKERMFDVMAAINAVVVDFPAARGDVILENVCGLGVDVIATSNLLSEEGERP
ncbi:MAG: DUF1667 domain-containing protein [Clostridia bacterium]|nr:DUF1667 domain-containing protein [Clostridia bacterium]